MSCQRNQRSCLSKKSIKLEKERKQIYVLIYYVTTMKKIGCDVYFMKRKQLSNRLFYWCDIHLKQIWKQKLLKTVCCVYSCILNRQPHVSEIRNFLSRSSLIKLQNKTGKFICKIISIIALKTKKFSSLIVKSNCVESNAKF